MGSGTPLPAALNASRNHPPVPAARGFVLISGRKVGSVRDFYGFYCNGKYQVGLSGTVWVYDMEDRLIGRFTETPYSYFGAFVPGTDVFVSHTNECHLVVYDLSEMRMLKKIKTSNCGADESSGLAFSKDGKRLCCVQADWNDWLKRRLVIYDTGNFEVEKEYFNDEDTLVLKEIEIENDGTCYISASERDVETGVITRHVVGIFRNGELAARRPYEEDWLTVTDYFSWKRSGYTKKRFSSLLRKRGFDPDDQQEPSSLKKLYETGRL